MVMAQAMFKRLLENRPSAVIDVLALSWSLPLLQRMPEVSSAMEMPLGHGQLGLRRRWRIGRQLRSGRYDQAIVMANSFKSALIPYWAGIPRRTGYLGEMRWGLLNDVRHLDKVLLPMTVQRFVALADDPSPAEPPAVPLPRLDVKPAMVAQALSALGLSRPRSRLLVLCPGAEYGPAKRWPAAHFAALVERMAARGWTTWLLGSDKDASSCAEIVGRARASVRNLCGATSLAQAVDLLSLADAVVSNDSGLMHVAAALDRPLVALYGSSDPGFTPPLSARARVVSLGLSCSPCFKRECPFGHLQCLRGLLPERVGAVLDEVAG